MDYNFGNRLKELRIQKGLTQKELGERVGVTKSVISFYELRERTPSPDVLIKLASVFHVSADELLGIQKKEVVDVSGLDEDDVKVVRVVVEQLRKKNLK